MFSGGITTGLSQIAKKVGKEKAIEIVKQKIKREMKKRTGRVVSDKMIERVIVRESGKGLSGVGKATLGKLGHAARSPKRLNRIAAEMAFASAATTSMQGLRAIKSGNMHLEDLGYELAFDIAFSGMMGLGKGSQAISRLRRLQSFKKGKA